MKKIPGFIAMMMFRLSCSNSSTEETAANDPASSPVAETPSPIVGTWKLVSATTIIKQDTTVTDYTRGQEMIKVINGSHFAFLRHDMNQGKDTAIFGAGGGTYTLSGKQLYGAAAILQRKGMGRPYLYIYRIYKGRYPAADRR